MVKLTLLQRWLSRIQKQTAYNLMVLMYTLLESYGFSGKSLRNFRRSQKAALLWRLSFGMENFVKDCFQPLVNRISIKTLEK